MPHIRTELRRQIITTLLNANIIYVGQNIYDSRKYQVGEIELPVISVWILEDDVQPEVGAMAQDPPFRHDTVATVEAHVSGHTGTEVADALDEIAVEIDQALIQNRNLGGFADTDLTPRDINFAYSGEANRMVGVMTYTFSVTYRATLSDPTTPAP